MIVRGSFRNVLAGMGCLTLLAACGGESTVDSEPEVFVQSIPSEQQGVIATEEVRPYVPDGQYASVLAECVLASTADTCTLATLPYIGQSGNRPTTQDVMSRVVVTHDWMGARFEQMLHRMPLDMLELFAPITAIVIGSEVRPSSYSSTKARIRIDPVYLWMSLPEKRTIATDDDFRTAYGADLLFKSYWRLAIGDNYATSYALNDDGEREIDDLDISLARLLYHELGHANDFMQYDLIPSVPTNLTPGQAAQLHENTFVAEQLHDQSGLTAQSSDLVGLAEVRYFDDEPNDFQRSVGAEYVGAEMGNEGRMTFYGYSTRREDVATLFASAMMKYHYDVEYHIAFVNKLGDETATSCDHIVSWGVRNRLAGPLVAPRAEFVTNKMLRPSANRDQFFASGLGAQRSLRVGEGWCSTVSNNPQSNKQVSDVQVRTPAPVELDSM